MKLSRFDWDAGNWPKCGKHGVSRAEIEHVLLNKPAVMPDPNPAEPRMRALVCEFQNEHPLIEYAWVPAWNETN